MSLRSYFSSIEPHFEKGGKFQKYYPIFEMIETIFFTSNTVTKVAPHARSFVDMKRIMTYVDISTIPCVLWALYNTGFQTNTALSTLNINEIAGWRIYLLQLTGLGIDPASIVSNVSHGLLYFLPIYITTLVAGGICEVVFATIRGHEVNEGFLVSSMLFALTLPASTPLWQVALGIAFGVVVAKEVFGGTGKNFLNPALTGRAFLYFAYPQNFGPGDNLNEIKDPNGYIIHDENSISLSSFTHSIVNRPTTLPYSINYKLWRTKLPTTWDGPSTFKFKF